MADSTLAAIRTKVRRLTRTPSINQMSDATLDEYINTFVVYDFPEQLRTFDLHTQMSFYTVPFVDKYPSGYFPLQDYVNIDVNTFLPAYVNGIKAYYTQSREQFYNIYPLNRTQTTVGYGNGVQTTFIGLISTPQEVSILPENVVISYIDEDGTGEAFFDMTIRTSNGPIPQGNLYNQANKPSTSPSTSDPLNNIYYETGLFTVTFTNPPAEGSEIIARYRLVQPSQPQGVLFWDNTFELRPVPDNIYQVNLEVNILPTQLLDSAQSPNVKQWWQYIAYGAAKKIFEDRMDMESVQMIMPEMKTQERLVLRKTLIQYTNQRTPTVYSEQTSLGSGTGYDGFNGF